MKKKWKRGREGECTEGNSIQSPCVQLWISILSIYFLTLLAVVDGFGLAPNPSLQWCAQWTQSPQAHQSRIAQYNGGKGLVKMEKERKKKKIIKVK